MTEAAAIQRGKGLEGVLGSYNPATPEQEGKVEIVGDNPFSALLEKYEAFLGRYDEYQKTNDPYGWIQNCIHETSTITDILTPNEINVFLQTTVLYEEREEYQDMTGIFITKLIQNSYNAGNNDFQLDTRSLAKNLDLLGAFLKGRKDREIQISIAGNVGNDCGRDANHSTYNITGSVKWNLGKYSNNSTFNITGDVGVDCGYEANNSTFNIIGNVGDWCGRDGENSTFKTSNRSTLKKLRKDVSYDSTIIYLHPDGTEEVIR